MVGVFPVIIKSSVRVCVSVFRVLSVDFENIKIMHEDFNSFGFLKININ